MSIVRTRFPTVSASAASAAISTTWRRLRRVAATFPYARAQGAAGVAAVGVGVALVASAGWALIVVGGFLLLGAATRGA